MPDLELGHCASVRRRDFISLLAAWPLAAHAQQVDGVRNIGISLGVAADDPQGKAIITALLQGLQELGRRQKRKDSLPRCQPSR